jgi:hypothetical protein
MSRCSAAFWAFTFFILLSLHAQTPTSDGSIWSGNSGKYKIEWTHSILRVTDGDQVVFDARADAERAWHRIVEHPGGPPAKAQFIYRVLSVVGPYLTLEQAEYCDCGGAHASAVKKFRTIRLDRSKVDSPQAASLRDLFPPEEILKSLASDAVVRKILGSGPAPTSLDDLVENLTDQTVKVKDCDYRFPPDLLSDFAVYDVKEGAVLVRLGLPAAAEVCRGQLTQLGLSLAPPGTSHTLLLAATKPGQGLLMAETQELPQSKITSFTFDQAAQR